MKDWLGSDYGPGDLVLYAAMSGRSVTMVLGRVVEIRMADCTTGHKEKVKIQPLHSARWKQHSARSYYVDTRNGKRIDPYAPSGKHVKAHGYHRDKRTHERLEYRIDYPYRSGYYTDAGRRVDYGDYEYISTEFQPWVARRTEDGPRPVTIHITANIVKWAGEWPTTNP